MKKRVLLTGALVLCLPLFAVAQGTASDGSVPPDPSSTPAPADTGTAQPAAQTPAQTTQQGSAPAGGTTPNTAPAATSAPSGGAAPRPTGSTPTAVVPVRAPSATTTVPGEPVAENPVTSPLPASTPWLWPVVAIFAIIVAIIPFGFLIAGWMKKKPASESEESDKRCFDIKQLMEDKLKELTDVKAMIKEHGVEKGKEMMRDAVSGTATGDLLVRAEKLEEHYKKLRALFEECKLDVDHYALKGVLLENSLLDKRMLKNLRIIRSRTVGKQVLHDIRISKSQIPDLQSNIVDQNWFFHLWEPGKDDVTVVFRDKIFDIKHSDKRTWEDAIVHGVMSGIPREKLVFDVVE